MAAISSAASSVSHEAKDAFVASSGALFLPSVNEVPEVNALSAIYSDVAAATKRYDTLHSAFTKKYGEAPSFYVRAPGRVNLIGEHIDYMGYGVLPMAIEHDVIIAVRIGTIHTEITAPFTIELAHVDHERFVDQKWTQTLYFANHSDAKSKPATDSIYTINRGETSSDVQWYHYFQAAFKGLMEDAKIYNPMSYRSPPDIHLMVHGTIPYGGGLSSSSAFVVASTIALLHAFGDIRMDRQALAECCAASERYVGTQGGGMDQAVSIFAERGVAQKIDFEPELTISSVPLPVGATFVVANSLVESQKAETASLRFNLRSIESSMASMALARHFGLISYKDDASNIVKKRAWRAYRKLAQTQAASNETASSIASLLRSGTSPLHATPYTLAELPTLYGTDVHPVETGFTIWSDELPAKTVILQRNVNNVLAANTSFNLQPRALHCYTEADRVVAFADQCRRSNAEGKASNGATLASLGGLMTASHISCRDSYDCSHPQLDQLVNICTSAGALGARLTGAGWGGCVVALVEDDKLDAFLTTVRKQFYNDTLKITDENVIAASLFPTKPGVGARIVRYSPSTPAAATTTAAAATPAPAAASST